MQVSCQFYTLVVHTEQEAIFCPLHGVPKKECFRDLISFKTQMKI